MSPDSITTLQAVGRRKVRAIAAEEDSPAALSLFDVAMGDKTKWTSEEWQAVLATLDNCDDRISDWLALRA